MHGGVDHQTGGVHGIGEHLIKRKVPGTGSGLIRKKDDYRFTLALLEFHLRHSGPHALHVSGESVGKYVLAGPVELEFFGHLGSGEEGVPGKFMYRLRVHPVGMGHYDGDIISAGNHGSIKYGALFLPGLGYLFYPGHDLGMRGGMPHEATDISLDHR